MTRVFDLIGAGGGIFIVIAVVGMGIAIWADGRPDGGEDA